MQAVQVLFVCMGNICRSPAAEGIMQSIVDRNNLRDFIKLDSAGTHGYHTGELPDERMRTHASKRGYRLDMKARQFDPILDFDDYDYILVMDENNHGIIHSSTREKAHREKIFFMTDFCKSMNPKEVPDPYYGGSEGFEKVLNILEDACDGFMDHLKQRHTLA